MLLTDNEKTQVNQRMYLSKREYDIMKVFWMEGKSLSKADFLWGDEEMKRSPRTIQRGLDGLSVKGMIKIAGEDALLGKIYRAVVSYAEWVRSMLCEIINESSEEEAMYCVLDAFAEKNGKISSGMVKTMKNYLEVMEEKLK